MITKAKYIICAVCAICGFYSCSDMLETESTRQNIDPDITQKTDSVFYAFGILQAMQQLADQYVMQGEMRGDLVKTTKYTDNNLRQLYDYTAGTDNKYDSAYVYYRVINNCNYYLAHVDTALYNGSTNVVIDKYIATKAIRAWAYLQLGRNYERVPFFTEPLTQISQIDRDYPELTLSEIVAQLAPDLEQYTGAKVPTLGYTGNNTVGIGSPNWESTAKVFSPSNCFIPVDIVLGDMYLETGNYAAAASHYVTYFTRVSDSGNVYLHRLARLTSKSLSTGRFGQNSDDDIPDASLISANVVTSDPWSQIFARNNRTDIITYIPMATTAQNGTITDVPKIFGFDYYATPEEKSRSGAPYIDEIQLLPSAYMETLSDSTEYYYYAAHTNQIDNYDSVSIAKCGDMRMRSIIHQEQSGDTAIQWIDKYKYATIYIYRTTTVWLRLAEALNRLGMPDAAFAILKDGINENMLQVTGDGSYLMSYITEATRNSLQTTYPLLSEANLSKFPAGKTFGIHTRGAGQAAGDYPGTSGTGGSTYHAGKSPYQLERMAGLKMAEIADAYGVAVGTTKQDTINAIEDMICDELALESAFEGNRYFDLLRLARHKNESALYGGSFGDLWLQKKLSNGERVWNVSKKYLPFK